MNDNYSPAFVFDHQATSEDSPSLSYSYQNEESEVSEIYGNGNGFIIGQLEKAPQRSQRSHQVKKPPQDVFTVFKQSIQKDLKKEFPMMSRHEITNIALIRWQELSPREREQYSKIFSLLHENYRLQVSLFDSLEGSVDHHQYDGFTKPDYNHKQRSRTHYTFKQIESFTISERINLFKQLTGENLEEMM